MMAEPCSPTTQRKNWINFGAKIVNCVPARPDYRMNERSTLANHRLDAAQIMISAKYVSAAAAMIILASQPLRAADGVNREPSNCPGGIAPPVGLYHEHGTRFGTGAMHEICLGKTVGTDRIHSRLGGGIAESAGPDRLRLNDHQLDTVAAGLAARADGAAQAEGADAGTQVDVVTKVGDPGPQNALSVGQVAASASGSLTTGPGTASSMLTLSVSVP